MLCIPLACGNSKKSGKKKWRNIRNWKIHRDPPAGDRKAPVVWARDGTAEWRHGPRRISPRRHEVARNVPPQSRTALSLSSTVARLWRLCRRVSHIPFRVILSRFSHSLSLSLSFCLSLSLFLSAFSIHIIPRLDESFAWKSNGGCSPNGCSGDLVPVKRTFSPCKLGKTIGTVERDFALKIRNQFWLRCNDDPPGRIRRRRVLISTLLNE